MSKGQSPRYKMTDEIRAKISVSLKGRKLPSGQRSPLLGRKRSPEFRAKISASLIGNRRSLGFKHSDETKAKVSKALKGKLLGIKKTPEHIANMSAARKGKRCKSSSLETRAKLSVSRMGIKFSAETKVKMSIAAKKRFADPSNHPRWRGGISCEPYTWTFTEELKAEVRQRDGHKCQMCGAPQKEQDRQLQVHHIDYDKQNSDPVNLIALCLLCHLRTNSNRDYWRIFFQTKVLDRARQLQLF